MTYALDTYRFQRLNSWITSTKLGSSLILPGIRLLDLNQWHWIKFSWQETYLSAVPFCSGASQRRATKDIP